MKKILSILLIFGVALSVSACSMKKNMTPEERAEYMSNEESKRVAESIEVEVKYSEGIAENVNEIGKSKKGKKLVIEIPYVYGKRYEEYYIGKDKLVDYCLSYFFYNDVETYEMNINIEDPIDKIVKKDKDARMIVKRKEADAENPQTYDDLIEKYTSEMYSGMGYKIVE